MDLCLYYAISMDINQEVGVGFLNSPLITMQHYSVPTKIMDWTTYVGLDVEDRKKPPHLLWFSAAVFRYDGGDVYLDSKMRCTKQAAS